MTEDATGNPLLAAALRCAARGWRVLPCRRKVPLTEHGYLDASSDPETIRAWWQRHPSANVGVATGPPAFDAIDIDTKAGVNGFKTLNRLLRAGLADGYFAIVRTPSAGMHLYYPPTDQGISTMREHGIDFRSSRGLVVVPPSTIDGKPYTVVEWRGGGQPVNWEEIRRFLKPPRPQRTPSTQDRPGDITNLAAWMARQQPGGRNSALFWACCQALENGATDLQPLIDAALTAGLSEQESRRTLASAVRRIGTKTQGNAA